MKKTFFSTIAIMLLLHGGPVACKRQQPQPLLQIDQHSVSLADFRAILGPLRLELADLPATEQKLLLRQTLSRLIDDELLRMEAERRALEISDAELQTKISELRGHYSPQEFRDVLQRSGQNVALWQQQLRMSLLRERLITQLAEENPPPGSEAVEKYYQNHQEDYRRPERLQARQILLKNRTEAQKIRERLLAGEDFATLARQYSQSPDREQGGNLGLIARGELPPEFERVLFTLKPKQISQVVESPYGIHLFLVEKQQEPGVLAFEYVKNDIYQQLQNQLSAENFANWLSRQRTQTHIEIDWQQLDKLHFDKAE